MKKNLWWKGWSCMHVSVHSFSREAATDRLSVYMKWLKKGQWAANKWNTACLLFEKCAVIYEYLLQKWATKPSDKLKNNRWCQSFSLLSQVRVAFTKGVGINHANHSLYPGLIFWTTVRKLACVLEIINKPVKQPNYCIIQIKIFDLFI